MAGFARNGLLSLILLTSTLPLTADPSAPSTTATRGFPSNEQLRHFKTMADPRLSPDGKRILIRITEPTADGAKSHLWLLGVDGEDPRQLDRNGGAIGRNLVAGEPWIDFLLGHGWAVLRTNPRGTPSFDPMATHLKN
jgi:hypothetical protein